MTVSCVIILTSLRYHYDDNDNTSNELRGRFIQWSSLCDSIIIEYAVVFPGEMFYIIGIVSAENNKLKCFILISDICHFVCINRN